MIKILNFTYVWNTRNAWNITIPDTKDTGIRGGTRRVATARGDEIIATGQSWTFSGRHGRSADAMDEELYSGRNESDEYTEHIDGDAGQVNANDMWEIPGRK